MHGNSHSMHRGRHVSARRVRIATHLPHRPESSSVGRHGSGIEVPFPPADRPFRTASMRPHVGAHQRRLTPPASWRTAVHPRRSRQRLPAPPIAAVRSGSRHAGCLVIHPPEQRNSSKAFAREACSRPHPRDHAVGAIDHTAETSSPRCAGRQCMNSASGSRNGHHFLVDLPIGKGLHAGLVFRLETH